MSTALDAASYAGTARERVLALARRWDERAREVREQIEADPVAAAYQAGLAAVAADVYENCAAELRAVMEDRTHDCDKGACYCEEGTPDA